MTNGYWALLPNNQKGVRFNTRDIWHFMMAFHQPKGGFYRGFSSYKVEGKIYSICRAGISADQQKAVKVDTPLYKNRCKDCSRIFKKMEKT